MVTVEFAPSLQRHVPCPTQQLQGATVFECLSHAFANAPALRHYVLDEQSALRKHVAVFVNESMVQDRAKLATPVRDGDRVLVIQALSGG
jgi:sulfur-carrier protein